MTTVWAVSAPNETAYADTENEAERMAAEWVRGRRAQVAVVYAMEVDE